MKTEHMECYRKLQNLGFPFLRSSEAFSQTVDVLNEKGPVINFSVLVKTCLMRKREDSNGG